LTLGSEIYGRNFTAVAVYGTVSIPINVDEDHLSPLKNQTSAITKIQYMLGSEQDTMGFSDGFIDLSAYCSSFFNTYDPLFR